MQPPRDMIDRRVEWDRLVAFATSADDRPRLGLIWGRRRVGKSFLLSALVEQTAGFYFEAVRGSSAEALRELGASLADYQGSAAPLALPDWEAAVAALLELARDRATLVVLDEFPYLLEHTPHLDSIIQRAFGPSRQRRASTQARLLLCGSATAVMRQLLTGTAPLRGRAGLDLRMTAFDFRAARALHRLDDLPTALRTYAVVGGVAAYGRDMVEQDLPAGPRDFDRWVSRRVLSPAAPLFNEVAWLLSEDPATARARKLNLYHAALAGIASGHQAHSRLTSYVQISGASLAPIVDGLVAAGLVERIGDPIRDNRPTYHPADSLLRFHYQLIRPNHARLARHDADTRAHWTQLQETFRAQVMGPCFESMARFWVTHLAAADTLGGDARHVGPTEIKTDEGMRQLDVVVAADDATTAAARTVRAIGEAKAGERITIRHLQRLEAARRALGSRATDARLLLFGSRFSHAVTRAAVDRSDLEVIDLERLYTGS